MISYDIILPESLNRAACVGQMSRDEIVSNSQNVEIFCSNPDWNDKSTTVLLQQFGNKFTPKLRSACAERSKPAGYEKHSPTHARQHSHAVVPDDRPTRPVTRALLRLSRLPACTVHVLHMCMYSDTDLVSYFFIAAPCPYLSISPHAPCLINWPTGEAPLRRARHKSSYSYVQLYPFPVPYIAVYLYLVAATRSTRPLHRYPHTMSPDQYMKPAMPKSQPPQHHPDHLLPPTTKEVVVDCRVAQHPSLCDRSTEHQPLLTSTPATAVSASPHINDPRRENIGYLLTALSTIGFSLNSFLIHVAESQYQFPPPSSVFIRGLVQTLLSVAYLGASSQLIPTITSTTKRQFRLLLVRGLVGSLAILSLYMAVNLIPVGDAVAIFFIGPAITLILSNVVLHEPVSVVEVMAAALSIVGAALVTHANGNHTTDGDGDGHTILIQPARRVIGSLCAVLSAMLSAVAITAIRHLGASVHFISTVVSFGLCCTVMAIPFGGLLSFHRFAQFGYGSIAVVVAACVGFAGQCCISLGLQRCRIAPAILLLNLEVPLSYVLGMVFLSEQPTLLRAVGSCCVFVAAIVIRVHP